MKHAPEHPDDVSLQQLKEELDDALDMAGVLARRSESQAALNAILSAANDLSDGVVIAHHIPPDVYVPRRLAEEIRAHIKRVTPVIQFEEHDDEPPRGPQEPADTKKMKLRIVKAPAARITPPA